MAELTLRRAREERDLSREELARRSQVSVRTIYRIEVDGQRPQRSTMALLAFALGTRRELIDWPTTRLAEAA